MEKTDYRYKYAAMVTKQNSMAKYNVGGPTVQ